MSSTTLRAALSLLPQHASWANRRLLGACLPGGPVTEAQYHTVLPCLVFGSLHATMAHVWLAQVGDCLLCNVRD